MRLADLYRTLLAAYGPRGWWPVTEDLPASVVRPPSSVHGPRYHPGDCSFPRTPAQAFEVCAGAILTQNTAWTNAAQAIRNLQAAKALSPEIISRLPLPKLANLIRPSGFFNQKAKRLRLFAKAVAAAGGTERFLAHATRDSLLGMHGIGPETADSILCYAAKKPVFVVDAYTRRIFSRYGLVPENAGYDAVQSFVRRGLRPSHASCNEFHALLVEHAKRHCRNVPACAGCPLEVGCEKKFS